MIRAFIQSALDFRRCPLMDDDFPQLRNDFDRRLELAKAGGFEYDVDAELAKARSGHGPQKSLHEGLAVLWEEFEEVKAEVFKKYPDRAALRTELVQVAAMAQRMAEDNNL